MAQKRQSPPAKSNSAGARTDRLDANAWIDAALDILTSADIDSVGIEPLAKLLGVTKGSFYWHFKDRAALLQAMLRKWQQRATLEVIERVEHSHKPPLERVRQLIDLPYSSPKARQAALVERAIRSWGLRDEMAAAALTEVDEQRLKYLAALFKGAGCKDEEARARAYLVYAFNFAESLIYANENAEELRKRRDVCAKVLIGR